MVQPPISLYIKLLYHAIPTQAARCMYLHISWQLFRADRCGPLQDHYCLVLGVNDKSGELKDYGFKRWTQGQAPLPAGAAVGLPNAD